MFSTSDTIVGIATPPGRGGLGVVRLSGPDACSLAERLAGRTRPFQRRRATLVGISSGDRCIDRALVTTFTAPHSYTGEDVAEISAHGSPPLLEAICARAMDLGARLAEPGEFTYRAFLNGRLDLVQAEAVRDLVDAVTPLQARAAYDQLEGTLTRQIAQLDEQLFDLAARLEASLDFPEEGYHFVSGGDAAREIEAIAEALGRLLADAHRGRLLREGFHVVLAGRPNVGKSSLFNCLAGTGRAIVTAIPGTTRDLITEVVDIDGVPVTIVDTAGARLTPADDVEAEGMARAAGARAIAGVVVVVLDGAAPLDDTDRALLAETAPGPRVIAANKSDLPAAWIGGPEAHSVIRVSAQTGGGLDALRASILRAAGTTGPERDVPAITNLRHANLLARSYDALRCARDAAAGSLPEEVVLEDLREARACLEEITGRRTPDDVLARIFSSFCIGK